MTTAAPFGRQFLADPASFPGPSEGRAFGDERLVLRIAGQDLHVRGLDQAQAEMLRSLWSAFVTAEPSDGAIPIAVYRAEPSAFRDFERRGWSYELAFDHGISETRLAGLDLMARLDWSPELAAALWTAAEAPETFRGAFENLLRVLLAHVLLAGGGVLVHSSSVVENGSARLFLGPSGAGKSTVARLALASGREVPSDDLNPVVPGDEGFRLFGSPFLGDEGSRRARSYPLRALYRLVQGDRDALREMGPAETVATLAACSPFVNRSPYLDERLLASLVALAERVPGYVLTFSREGTFWPLLDP